MMSNPTYTNPYGSLPGYAPLPPAREKPLSQIAPPKPPQFGAMLNNAPMGTLAPRNDFPYPGMPPVQPAPRAGEGTPRIPVPGQAPDNLPQPSPTPPPASTNPASTMAYWLQQGYINQDGTITLPWGGTMPIKDAMALFYPNEPPSANEVPKWIPAQAYQAGGVPLHYWNELPPALRQWTQGLFDQAYTNSLNRPPITNMSAQAQYT